MPATTFETDGFLSDEIIEVIRAFKAESPALHEDFRHLGRLAHQRKNSQPVLNRDVQQLMIVLLIGRMLSLYEAIYVLACRGMKSEHQTLLRAMLEAHLKLHLCIKSKKDAEEVAMSGEHERPRLFSAASKYLKATDSPEKTAELENMKSKAVADNKALGVKKIKIEDLAKRTGRDWEYDLAYASLCRPAHTDSVDLQADLDLNEQGDIVGILWGPNHEEAGFNLATAMDYLFQAITNPVIPMLAPDTQEAQRLRVAINGHIRTQHELKLARKGAA